MIKTVPSKQVFGVPTLETATRIDDADRVARAQAEHYRLSARMRQLECEFEAKASELRAAYAASMAEIFASEEEN
jgi:hypothetical protein